MVKMAGLTETLGEQRQDAKPKTNTEISSATLLHDTVFVNARFSDHVIAEPVAFGVLTVRFTNNLYVTSPSNNLGKRNIGTPKTFKTLGGKSKIWTP